MITGFYAGLLAVFYVALSAYVIKARFQHKVSLGDGGVPVLTARIRAHANFAEYVPFALILMLFVEDSGADMFVHVLGIMLIAGRLFHAVALTKLVKIPFSRQIGMGLTLTAILIAAIYLIGDFLF
jgi:uncharacterized protein